jgi:hypothetical protein
MILFGERSLRHVLGECIAQDHEEHLHQGKGNVILFPSAQAEPDSKGTIGCRERLGDSRSITPVGSHECFERTGIFPTSRAFRKFITS